MSSVLGATPQSIAALCGKLQIPFTLAALAIQNGEAEQIDEEAAYEGAAPSTKAGARSWTTYERLMADEEAAALAAASRTKSAKGAVAKAPRLKVHPITSVKEARYALGAFIVAAADCIVAGPAATLAALAGPSIAVIRFMESAVAQLRVRLSTSPLNHDHMSVASVRRALDLLIGTRTGAKTVALARAAAIRFAPVADQATRLIVDFMKCVAWECAALAFERGCGERQLAWSLNLKTFHTILALFGDNKAMKKYVNGYLQATLQPVVAVNTEVDSKEEAAGAASGASAANADDDADDDAADDAADDEAEDEAPAEEDEEDAEDNEAAAARPAGTQITVLEYDE
jgi:hypothetical protein